MQNPVKWQPNEIDGLYFSDYTGTKTLYPSEAKALSTGDHINLEQMLGAYQMVMQKIPTVQIIPLGLQMIVNGIRIGVFKEKDSRLEIDQYIQVTFDPPIKSWRPRSAKREKTSHETKPSR